MRILHSFKRVCPPIWMASLRCLPAASPWRLLGTLERLWRIAMWLFPTSALSLQPSKWEPLNVHYSEMRYSNAKFIYIFFYSFTNLVCSPWQTSVQDIWLFYLQIGYHVLPLYFVFTFVNDLPSVVYCSLWILCGVRWPRRKRCGKLRRSSPSFDSRWFSRWRTRSCWCVEENFPSGRQRLLQKVITSTWVEMVIRSRITPFYTINYKLFFVF